MVLLIATRAGAQTVALEPGQALVLGRSAEADIQLSDADVSRRHARFAREGDAVRVTDLGSRNGTWVHGERVTEALLHAGENAVLGNVIVSAQAVSTPSGARLGLSTRAHALNRLREEWQRAQLFRRSFSVLMLRPLRGSLVDQPGACAACLAHLRSADHVSVYEREALLAVLPETTEAEALQLARKLCTADAGSTRAMGCGVVSYPASGASPEELVSAAWQAAYRTSARNLVVVAPSVNQGPEAAMVRSSPAMQDLQVLIERVAPRPLPVLVTGETGAGKELVAREVHRWSRRSGRMRAVNCAAIPEHLLESVLFGHVRGSFTGADRDHKGIFEQAQGGTVFLDEVGELSLKAQAALLRVLETEHVSPVGSSREIRVDVRIVAATHRDLAELSSSGAFRLDLYHRLNAMILHLPPLRERKQELAALVDHFLGSVSARWGCPVPRVSSEALACLHAHAWPGNVRELRNVIERAVALCTGGVITREDLPERLRLLVTAEQTTQLTLEDARRACFPPAPSEFDGAELESDLRAQVDAYEAELIRSALRATGGHQRKAAEILKVPLRTLERKLRTLRLPSTPS